ncbi:Putative fluoride ion transporter CrcB [Corynebacterium atrinae]|uniref:FluC/FEX family fluoride channel n=1 Tax=Corynebacterium atrinae TaxID=1336740 RepID=UPI0025B5DA2D|nr:CrcB family protein [Corynebacterium atrinae]WJY64240.1 Putative fluoride ion transporter CrcB [Corynebacterium atrinae]
MSTALLLVAAGGFLGGLGRWALSRWPGGLVGTWTANVLACVVVGAVVAKHDATGLLWGTGFAGALSTWSTLARELGELVKRRRWRTVILYAAATLSAGLAGVGLGILV